MTATEKKAKFVIEELTALIKKIDSGIGRLEYAVDQQRGEEYVRIYSADGEYIKKVCVTADSLYAIVVDVLKKIE